MNGFQFVICQLIVYSAASVLTIQEDPKVRESCLSFNEFQTDLVITEKRTKSQSENIITVVREVDNYKSSDCLIPEWNHIRTDSIPKSDLHNEFMKRRTSGRSYLYGETPGIFSAFAHNDKIIVTLTTENLYGKSCYCRYYDCNRNEIMDQFESVVYPESTVFCARRVGAKYISITRTLNEKPEYSVPIVPRIDSLKHFFTVCMAPLYGEEAKFLQLAEFIEYYKLQGATFFHIYVRNVTNYDRIILDDYVRTGEIEVVKMHDHHWRDDWLWHNPQINDCHQRSKYFSKWTAFIDLDEHIEMKTERFKRIVNLLDHITDPNVINLHFRVQWVIKNQDLPARYINDKQITDEMIFLKYKNTSRVGGMWDQPKCIIRPEKIVAMSIHFPREHYTGLIRTLVTENIGVARHYRNMQEKVFPGAQKIMMSMAPFVLTDVSSWIKTELTKEVLIRVKKVYELVDITCENKRYVFLGNEKRSECKKI